jgi:CRISPR-associated protein Csd2
MSERHLDPTVKHDIVYLYDVTDGNPNGDPDAGNRPRTDDESGHGLATDGSLKRKIRDTIGLAAQHLGLSQERYEIFVAAGDVLNNRIKQTLDATGIDVVAKKGQPVRRETIEAAHRVLFDRYVDVRLFGAVLSTGDTGALGHVRGPVQVAFSRSVDPVVPIDHAITRVVATNERDAGKRTEMGGKWTVPYGLYRAVLHYSAPVGVKAGVTGDDLRALYHALQTMFEHTRSATRTEMYVQGLYVFSHSTPYGDTSPQALLQRIRVSALNRPPRSFDDYKVEVDDAALPPGVNLERLIG